MCGTDGNLCIAIIEGAELNICEKCSRFGKVIRRTTPSPVNRGQAVEYRQQLPKKEIIQTIVENYSELIRKGREKLGLTQKEMAIRLAEKESILQKLETGEIVPSLDLARKLERFFRIKLIEQHEEAREHIEKSKKSQGMTIGDILKI